MRANKADPVPPPPPSAGSLAALVALGATAALGFLFLWLQVVMGVFCVGCLAADLMIAGYAGIALFSWARLGYPQLARAATLAGLACFAGYLALLYPGLHTPNSAAEAGRAAISRVAVQAPDRQLVQLVDSPSSATTCVGDEGRELVQHQR